MTGTAPEVVPDPSVAYVRRQQIRARPNDSRVIRGWFRKLTPEYPQSTRIDEATERVANFLHHVLAWYPTHELELGAMHWFPVGGDDRKFARELVVRLGSDRVRMDPVPRTPAEILVAMAGAELNLCMRFHSVVFAHTIGAPFVAIDYTAGGKVAGFLAKAGLAGRELRYSDLPGLTPDAFSSHVCGPANLVPAK